MTPSSVTSTSYRPFITLNCEMTRWLVDNIMFSSCPFIIADAGARSGFDSFQDIFKDQCQQIGFETDKEEYVRLRHIYDRSKKIENVALWQYDGVRADNLINLLNKDKLVSHNNRNISG